MLCPPVCTQYKATALGYGVKSGVACVVKNLIAAGADIEGKTFGDSLTPLLMFFASGLHGFLKLDTHESLFIFNSLRDSGANVNAIDKWHATPLMYAAMQSQGEYYVKELLQDGADATAIADVKGGPHGAGHPRTALAW